MSQRVIDINYYDQASDALTILRACTSAAKLDFEFSSRLTAYLGSMLQHVSLEEIQQMSLQHYGYLVFSTDELARMRESILRHCRWGRRSTLMLPFPRQLHLFLNKCMTEHEAQSELTHAGKMETESK